MVRGIIARKFNISSNVASNPNAPRTEELMMKRARAEIEKCDLVEDFDERLACKSALLHDVSVVQDIVNLNIMGDFRKEDPECSKDRRWESVHFLDDANAVFLGVSEYRFDPKYYLPPGYVDEKAARFCSRRYDIKDENERGELKLRTEEDKARSRAPLESVVSNPMWIRKYRFNLRDIEPPGILSFEAKGKDISDAMENLAKELGEASMDIETTLEVAHVWNPIKKEWVPHRPWWEEEKEPYEWEK